MFKKVDHDSLMPPRCECCGKFLGEDSEVPSVCYSVGQELAYLGPATTLFFHYIKVKAYELLLLFILVALHAIVSNLTARSC